MAADGPNSIDANKIGTPLGSNFKNGGMNGSGNSKNINTVEIAAKIPIRVIFLVFIKTTAFLILTTDERETVHQWDSALGRCRFCD